MCKYCEEVERTDELYVQYGMKGDHYIAYRKRIKQFELWSADDDCSSAIQFCPWCGRELKMSEENVESTTDTKVRLLKESLIHTNTLLYKLAEDLERWVDRDRYNIDMKAEVLQDIKDIKRQL